MRSLIIPIYKNEDFMESLVERCGRYHQLFQDQFEVVFVNDGTPDKSISFLIRFLQKASFQYQVISHTRNFGSFAAIRTGLKHAKGEFLAVMAADLQEPEDLIVQFFEHLAKKDVEFVYGERIGRDDPYLSRLASNLFWLTYRKFIQPDMPAGGIDIFGCTAQVSAAILAMGESNTSLVGQLIWVGFSRRGIPYHRLPRKFGKSAWSFSRKVRYLGDSLFSFSDLPIRILLLLGFVGLSLASVFLVVVLYAKITGNIAVPGYATIISLILFFSSLNTIALGVVGSYVWRAYENTKQRPESIVYRSITANDK